MIRRKIRLSELTIDPSFRLSEILSPGLSDKKENQKFRGIVNFKVVEKTKSFMVLRISSVMPFPSARII